MGIDFKMIKIHQIVADSGPICKKSSGKISQIVLLKILSFFRLSFNITILFKPYLIFLTVAMRVSHCPTTKFQKHHFRFALKITAFWSISKIAREINDHLRPRLYFLVRIRPYCRQRAKSMYSPTLGYDSTKPYSLWRNKLMRIAGFVKIPRDSNKKDGISMLV